MAAIVAARDDGGMRRTTTTCSVRRMTVDLNLPDGASPPASVFWALSRVWDAMANRTYRYGGNDNSNIVVVRGGRVHPAVWIAEISISRSGEGGSSWWIVRHQWGGIPQQRWRRILPLCKRCGRGRGGDARNWRIPPRLIPHDPPGGRSGKELYSINVGGRSGGQGPLSPRGPLSGWATGGRGLGIDPIRGYPGR